MYNGAAVHQHLVNTAARTSNTSSSLHTLLSVPSKLPALRAPRPGRAAQCPKELCPGVTITPHSTRPGRLLIGTRSQPRRAGRRCPGRRTLPITAPRPSTSPAVYLECLNLVGRAARTARSACSWACNTLISSQCVPQLHRNRLAARAGLAPLSRR